jgi:hypothetical protein
MSIQGKDSDTLIAVRFIDQYYEWVYFHNKCLLCESIIEDNESWKKLHLFNDHTIDELSYFVESSKVYLQ